MAQRKYDKNENRLSVNDYKSNPTMNHNYDKLEYFSWRKKKQLEFKGKRKEVS